MIAVKNLFTTWIYKLWWLASEALSVVFSQGVDLKSHGDSATVALTTLNVSAYEESDDNFWLYIRTSSQSRHAMVHRVHTFQLMSWTRYGAQNTTLSQCEDSTVHHRTYVPAEAERILLGIRITPNENTLDPPQQIRMTSRLDTEGLVQNDPRRYRLVHESMSYTAQRFLVPLQAHMLIVKQINSWAIWCFMQVPV